MKLWSFSYGFVVTFSNDKGIQCFTQDMWNPGFLVFSSIQAEVPPSIMIIAN